MRKHEIEYWVLRIIDMVVNKQPVEDDRVELKSIWSPDHKKTARQIAGHANAARGEPILWIIGVDERKGVKGVDHEELSNWFNSVKSCFDESLAPDLTSLVVPYDNKTVTALFFETDRAPFVIKNRSGGQITHEVPWREGNSTRSAKRTDLIKILSPLQRNPVVDILGGELILRKYIDTQKMSEKFYLSLKLELYVTTISTNIVVIPFHNCNITLKPQNSDNLIYLDKVRLDPPTRTKLIGQKGRIQTEVINRSLTIRSTDNEVLINTAGLLYLKGELDFGESFYKINDEIVIKAILRPVNAEIPISILGIMQQTGGEEHERGIKQWKLKK